MPTYVALLRAVNVGGTGKLPMSDLTALCKAAGFAGVRTYIASGNVVFNAGVGEAAVRAALEAKLHAYAGRNVGVLVRTGAEMAAVAACNPFAALPSKRTVAIFLPEAPDGDTLAGATGRGREELRLGAREIYVYYPDGLAETKLRIRAAATGTARNMNTVAKLAELAAR
jgi:uncharacterized protein (DUF1697 family)